MLRCGVSGVIYLTPDDNYPSYTYLKTEYYNQYEVIGQNIFGENISIGLSVLHVKVIIKNIKVDEFMIIKRQKTPYLGSKMGLSIPRATYLGFSL